MAYNVLVKTISGGIQQFRASDAVDIAIITVLIYHLILLTKETRAFQVLKGIGIVFIAALVSDVLQLVTISWLLNSLLSVGIILAVVLFQPELRRALEHIGRGNLFSREFFGSIIENIFEPNTPLHDGAMIIRNNEIVAAACILPLVEDIAVARELGTRHRAGLGISSVSDSITIIVSEETGVISMARDGKLVRYIDSKALRNLLESIFIHKEREFQMPSLSSFRRRKGNQK